MRGRSSGWKCSISLTFMHLEHDLVPSVLLPEDTRPAVMQAPLLFSRLTSHLFCHCHHPGSPQCFCEQDEPLASSGWFSFPSQPGSPPPPHQSEKSKPFGPDYYLPPLPRVISTPHPIRLSSQTVAESLYYFSEVSFWIRLFNLGSL